MSVRKVSLREVGVRIGVVMDPETARQLEELARETKRTRTAVIELAVEDYYNRWSAHSDRRADS